MTNQVKQGQGYTDRFCNLPAGVSAGDPIFVGTLPGVVKNTTPAAPWDQTVIGGIVHFSGSYSLSVHAATVVSPLTGSTVNPGDKIYGTGTLDTATNVTYALTLSKASGGALFGNLDQAASLTTGTTGTVTVELLK